MRTKSPRRPDGRVVLLTALLAALAAGCGYSTTSRTAKDIKSIYVPFFENQTAEPSLEIRVTDSIVQNLVRDNTLKVVSEDAADAVLDGQITEFRDRPFSFNDNLNAEEYIVAIKMVVSLFNRRTNEPIWQNRTIEGNGSYFIEQVENGRTREDAIAESLEEITNQILNLTVQDW